MSTCNPIADILWNLLRHFTTTSQTASNDAEGSEQGVSSYELQLRDLPSKRLLGEGLGGIGYETEWKERRCARKEFIGVPSDIFREEAANLVRLEDHKNIVKTYGWTVDKRSCSLVLELMDDDLLGSLQKRKESKRDLADTGRSGTHYEPSHSQPFELLEALNVIKEIAEGMKQLHDNRIGHGDLKTRNILVNYTNDAGDTNFLTSVKVADFGLDQTKKKSIFLVSRQARKLDMVQWKAPEYLRLFGRLEDKDETSDSDSNSDENASTCSGADTRRLRSYDIFAADVYSFGLVCWQILTGEDPYPNLNSQELVERILDSNLRPKLLDAWPLFLKILLQSCWDKDPSKRPTFSNIVQSLQEILQTNVGNLDLKETSKIISSREDSERTSTGTSHEDDKTGVEKCKSGRESQEEVTQVLGPISSIDAPSPSGISVTIGGSPNTPPKAVEVLNIENLLEPYPVSPTSHDVGLKNTSMDVVNIPYNIEDNVGILNKFGKHGAPSSSSYFSVQSASGGGGTGSRKSGGRASLEEVIEQSKSHWSSLADQSDGMSDYDEVAEESNVQVFQDLQLHPFWGSFFQTFGGDGMSMGERNHGELRGEKFAEGAQAELFQVHVTWKNPKYNEYDVEKERQWVVKVFKKGTFLHHFRLMLLDVLKKFHAKETEKYWLSTTYKRIPSFRHVNMGTILKDGRFAFLMEKEDFDLRTLIDYNMALKCGKKCVPFSKKEAELLMYQVAMGVDWLHGQDIIHRDLKASNVLIKVFESVWPKWECSVVDYECSVLVVGTGFFRAPEILQACKERNVSQNQEVFSKAADVYSYGMTCYEILTGKLPFEGHAENDYDVVLNGGRPKVPRYVEDWIRELLSRCWESNPRSRPTIGEILDLFVANSTEAKRWKESLRMFYGNKV